jgi:MFS family permease
MSVTASATGDSFLSWGWRIPFLLSAVLVLVGLWIRLGVLAVSGLLAAGYPTTLRFGRAPRSSRPGVRGPTR